MLYICKYRYFQVEIDSERGDGVECDSEMEIFCVVLGDVYLDIGYIYMGVMEI